MESIPDHPLIIVTDEDVRKARQFYDLNDPKRIKESIDTVREWLTKQDHLAAASQYLSDNMLERIFILARGSVEGTKTKLDRLLTLRSMMPELSLNRTVEEFEQFWGAVNYLPLPKLNKLDQSRVCLTQVLTDKLDRFDLLGYFRYCFVVGEYRLHFDYSISERYVIDMKNIHVGHLRKLNPVVMKKSEVLCTEGFGTKIKGIHILNAPSFVDRILLILKQALKEKVASRIHVHSSYKDLHKHIPKEILPSDYDGDGPSCAKLAEQWMETFRTKEAQEIIRNLDHLVADESKRQSAKFNEEYLGMPGSFRKLDVD